MGVIMEKVQKVTMDNCLRCSAPMERVGDNVKGMEEGRVYIHTAITLGEEDTLYFDLYYCSECSYSEIRKR